jgi:hypothetical protein
MTEWAWTWGGSSFGWIDDDALYTHDGRHVGYVERDDDDVLVFSIADGYYLGQLRGADRLITKESRLGRHRRPRRERMQRMARSRRMDRLGKMMPFGYRDFPEPEAL